MPTTAPEILNDLTVGQVVAPPVLTPTPASTFASTPSGVLSTPTPSSQPSIGERMYLKTLSIYGYAPAKSVIKLAGFGVSEETISDSNGYFSFNRIFSNSVVYPELCIQAIDEYSLSTSPVCIPGLSLHRTIPQKIGPVFLPPTISLKDNNLILGNPIIVRGSTIPNGTLEVYIASNFFLPVYQIPLTDNGKYEFLFLPQRAQNYRISVSGKVGDQITARSNVLGVYVLSKSESKMISTKDFVNNNKIPLFIILELVVILILGFLIIKIPSKRKK